MKTKILMFLTLIVLICTIVRADGMYEFTDEFQRISSSMYNGVGVKFDSFWASKSTGTMDGDGTGVTTFGLDGQNLVVNTFKQDTYPKISSGQLSKMPGFNWTTDHSNLDKNIKITATVTKPTM